MGGSADQLVVRQHERRSCRLEAGLRVAAEHTHVVALSRSVGDGTGSISATVVDVSNGGAGVETAVFLPRGTSVNLTVRTGSGSETIELPSRVQRVTMISREPRYYMGLAYAGDQASRSRTIGLLLERTQSEHSGEGAAR
jgi:hypothetical protein